MEIKNDKMEIKMDKSPTNQLLVQDSKLNKFITHLNIENPNQYPTSSRQTNNEIPIETPTFSKMLKQNVESHNNTIKDLDESMETKA